MRGDVAVLRRPDELSLDWLRAVLGAPGVERFEVEPVGTGQMSDTVRVRVAGGGGEVPASVIVKTAASDEASRATGTNLGAYEREISFYRELAPRIGGPIPACHAAVIDSREGWFTLVLEDVVPAVQGDQLAGCDLERARLAVAALARLHAPVLGDPQLGATPWLNQPNPLDQALMGQLLDAFLERHGSRVAPAHEEVCRRFVASLDAWSADRRPPLGLVHGDYRLDNMLFGIDAAQRSFAVVDWQTVGWGPAMTDLSYFLGASLTPERRRAGERELVRAYHDALLDHGVSGFGWEQCWEEYRRRSFLGLIMTIAPAMIVQRTERGDEMFLTSLARYAEQILDLDALSLLPEPGTARLPALVPEERDEGRHPPGPEQLWNESWYFDAISADGRLGLYTRLGLYPNLGVCWLTSILCGPDRQTVAAIDFAGPLPEGECRSLAGEDWRAEHLCESPLDRFRVRLRAAAQRHADPAALLRGEAGGPVALEFDLEWRTDGVPYAYRVATRYEIPCRVSGTVRCGEELIELDGSGQRDHSWGPRDWWSADWMWSAGALGDGTRLHGVEFRVPGAPPIGVGYEQPPQGGVQELDTVRAREQVTPEGLVAGAEIEFGTLFVSVEPLAFGPLRLTAPDGRVAEFPRAMCRLRAADGRQGLGWVEWNRNTTGP